MNILVCIKQVPGTSQVEIDEKNATTNHEHQAELIRKVMATSERNYLIVDRSKQSRTGLHRLAPIGAFDAVFCA